MSPSKIEDWNEKLLVQNWHEIRAQFWLCFQCICWYCIAANFIYFWKDESFCVVCQWRRKCFKRLRIITPRKKTLIVIVITLAGIILFWMIMGTGTLLHHPVGRSINSDCFWWCQSILTGFCNGCLWEIYIWNHFSKLRHFSFYTDFLLGNLSELIDTSEKGQKWMLFLQCVHCTHVRKFVLIIQAIACWVA